MSEEMQLKGNARMVKGTKALNQEGCRFFCESGDYKYTLITSASLRWLTFKDKGNAGSDAQEEANKKILEASNNRTNPVMGELKVLLYENPKGKKKDVEHIKALLNCGESVDVRYGKVKKDHRWRLAMNNNRIFLSSTIKSGGDKCTVNQGWVYETTETDDMLVEYLKYEFEEDFEVAKRLKLKGDKIVYYDNWWQRAYNWCNTDRVLAILGIIIGAVIAFILR